MGMNRWVLQALVACAAWLFVPIHDGEPSQPPISWVEMGPSGLVLARVVTIQSRCPSITLDTQPTPMQIRALPQPGFPIRVCEAAIPIGTRAASVEGQALALPKVTPQRIVVIGDTGCRMKAPSSFQACNDPDAWPFAKVAESAARWKPDLVIHVGDYLYREAPCPDQHPGCAGSPWGDTWATWDADFFTPAAALLRVSPWVVVRGNHENCLRAGRGWVIFLDPRPAPTACRDFSDPYAVTAAPYQLLIFDSSATEPDGEGAHQEQRDSQRFAMPEPPASTTAWLLTHRPPGPFDAGNALPQIPSDDPFPPTVRLILSGHAHLFGVFTLPGSRLTQVIVGNSGTTLDRELAKAMTERHQRDMPGARVKAVAEFGFVTIERTVGSWTWIARNVDGAALTTCRFDGPAFCTP